MPSPALYLSQRIAHARGTKLRVAGPFSSLAALKARAAALYIRERRALRPCHLVAVGPCIGGEIVSKPAFHRAVIRHTVGTYISNRLDLAG